MHPTGLSRHLDDLTSESRQGVADLQGYRAKKFLVLWVFNQSTMVLTQFRIISEMPKQNVGI